MAKLSWNKTIYYGERAKADQLTIRRDIRLRSFRPFTYLIVLEEESKKPEIYHNAALFSSFLSQRSFQLIGIAEGKEEATALLGQIVTDVYAADRELNYAEYFGIPS